MLIISPPHAHVNTISVRVNNELHRGVVVAPYGSTAESAQIEHPGRGAPAEKERCCSCKFETFLVNSIIWIQMQALRQIGLVWHFEAAHAQSDQQGRQGCSAYQKLNTQHNRGKIEHPTKTQNSTGSLRGAPVLFCFIAEGELYHYLAHLPFC